MADTNLNDFIINKLTQAQYDTAEKDPNQLYIVTDADKYQEKLTAGHNITIDKNVISATDELPDQTGNIGKVLTTDGEKVGWVNPRIHNIFDYKWTDHKLYDIRWLRADPFSWQWKSAYETAYNHLVNDGSTQNAIFTLTSDGTFKILAGSTICIPTGFEVDGLTRKYTTVTIDTDTTITEHSGTDGWTGYLWYIPSSNSFSIGSGMFLPTTEIPTTSTGVYWNESSNKAELYVNGVYQEDYSFPIMRMTSSSTQITGILETYNGVNGFTKSTFTQNNITVTYYTATEDKHTICLPDQETNLESLFQATGKAWFYILDTQNERFKLPRDTNTEDSINNYLYFYVGDYTEDALKQTAGITAELLNDKVDITSAQTITGTKTFTSPVHLRGNSTFIKVDNIPAADSQQHIRDIEFIDTTDNRICVLRSEISAANRRAIGLNVCSDTNVNKGGLTVSCAADGTDLHVAIAGKPVQSWIVASQHPSSANGYKWYRKYSDGWVEQGVSNVDMTSAVYTFTFPITMKDTTYTVTTGIQDALNTTVMGLKYNELTTTSIQVRNSYQTSGSTLRGSIVIHGMAA